MRERPGLRAFVEVLLVAALAFTTTLCFVEVHKVHQAHNGTQVRSDVSAVSAALGTLLFTYDYHDLAKSQAKVTALATGAFAQQESTQSAAVQRQLVKAQAVGTATVKEVSVSILGTDHAKAFVVVTTHVTSSQGKADGTAYLHLDLVKTGGVWKVDDAQTLSAG